MNTEEFPLLKYHDGQSSELFGDGTYPKLGKQSIWYTMFNVGEAIPFPTQHTQPAGIVLRLR
jgi:hypothetical protein